MFNYKLFSSSLNPFSLNLHQQRTSFCPHLCFRCYEECYHLPAQRSLPATFHHRTCFLYHPNLLCSLLRTHSSLSASFFEVCLPERHALLQLSIAEVQLLLQRTHSTQFHPPPGCPTLNSSQGNSRRTFPVWLADRTKPHTDSTQFPHCKMNCCFSWPGDNAFIKACKMTRVLLFFTGT